MEQSAIMKRLADERKAIIEAYLSGIDRAGIYTKVIRALDRIETEVQKIPQLTPEQWTEIGRLGSKASEVEPLREELRKAQVCISQLRNCEGACLTCKWSMRTNCPKYNEAGKIAGQTYFNFKELDAGLERVVRDAVVDYNELFASAPNSDAEEELRKRAEVANKWLEAHHYKPEPFNGEKGKEQA